MARDPASAGGRSPEVRSRTAAPTPWMICAGLAVLVAFAFWPVLGNGFVSYDDDRYVTDNPGVAGGVGPAALRWAFTTTREGNWHPLTWISHQLDVEVFGMAPNGHHATSLLLHIANTILVFVVFATASRARGSRWRAALVAALFGVHPLHVESVAWIAERKDVLSTFFGLVAALLYVRAVRARGGEGGGSPPPLRTMIGVSLAYAASLMAKPTLVTLPFVLLLLDAWPLARIDPTRPLLRPLLPLVREKAVLFALSAASCAVTVFAQGTHGAIGSAETYGPGLRLANAAVALATYLRRTIWPSDLAVFYPFPRTGLPFGVVAASVAVIVGATILAATLRRRAPWLPAGWAWFAGTLVPMIGLVQVGDQAMADRYTYVPLIGIFLAIAWSLPARFPGATATAVVAVLLALAAATHLQAARWKDSLTLFEHALAVTRDNYVAHDHLGTARMREGRLDDARRHLGQAISIRPGNAQSHYNLGVVLGAQGHAEEAIASYRRAIAGDPYNINAHGNLGAMLARQGRLDEAIAQYRYALGLDPHSSALHNNLGAALRRLGRFDEALREYTEAVRLDPRNARAHYNAGDVRVARGELGAAIAAFERAIAIDPDYELAYAGLVRALIASGRGTEAREMAEVARRRGLALR